MAQLPAVRVQPCRDMASDLDHRFFMHAGLHRIKQRMQRDVTVRLLCFHAGLGVRMSTTFVVMQCGYTPLEAVWFAIAWIPKVR